jgi:hypothetical protein
MAKPKVRSITVIGRRWFQRSAGNTYCSATILVDGKYVAKLVPSYGYGEHYETLASERLSQDGITTPQPNEVLWRYCERNGIAYHREVADVAREKDL